MILDSNIVIYSILPEHERLRTFIEENVPAVSLICRIEVLGFHKINQEQQAKFAKLFDGLPVLPISRDVADKAVALRQQRRMSLGDAITAGTALVHDRVLVTRNVSDFEWVAGLKLRNPFDAQQV